MSKEEYFDEFLTKKTAERNATEQAEKLVHSLQGSNIKVTREFGGKKALG
jgi:hypothetical protein